MNNLAYIALSFRRSLRHILPICLSYICTSSFAQSGTYAKSAFDEDYLTFELTRNMPLAYSQKSFRGGNSSTVFGFRHVLSDRWMMGISAGFKNFEKKSDDKELDLFTISQETLFLIRLYHPSYLGVGPRLLYLLPTTGKTIPPEADKDFEREAGAALSLNYIFILNDRVTINARLDRWRGLNTEKFFGIESALGLSYSLP